MPIDDKNLTRASFLGLVAAAPFAGKAFAQSANAAQTFNFHFSGDSYRPTSNCGPTEPCDDRLVMGGSGQISGKFHVGQTVLGGQVNAQGSFAHYEKNLPAGNNIPLAFTGTWKATSLVSFQLLGVYGTDSEGNFPLAAGVLVLNIELVRPPTTAIPLTKVPSLLTLVSNLQPAGVASSGRNDGVYLIAPNPGGYVFQPIQYISITPGVGEAYTPVLFSTLNESRGNTV